MKKALKIFGIFILVVVIILIAAPFVFETQIENFVKKTINKNVNAQVEFSEIDLSFFRSFPQATVVLSDVSVINKAPFEGDTLALSEEVLLEMSIKELFKGSEEPKSIDEFRLNNAYVNIKVDSLGNANYDIAIEDTTATAASDTTTASGFSLDLKHYEINNSRLKYVDEGSKMSLHLEDLNHNGTGDFSLNESELDTETTALVTFDFDGTNYLNRNKVALDAVIQMDLENMRYTFLENEAMINQLPLTFDGYVQVNEENNEIDLSFKTPSSDFKNFLAVIPEEYAKNIENVETNGDFVVNGIIRGVVDETYIPKMDIKVSSNNASFKYPDLPKSVQDINLDLQIINETGLVDDTYITFDNVTFRIDQDRFAASGSVRNLMENMLVNMNLDGTINLANIEQAYPLDMDLDLNGILTADLTTSFDMNSIENEQYQNVNSKGAASIRNFSYRSPEIPNEVQISSANLNFNQGDVTVPDLKMTTGQTDITASGTIQNLMGFLFTEQALKGNFQVNSNTFAVNDFMVAEAEETVTEDSTETSEETTPPQPTGEEAVKIPSFLDVIIAFNANRVLYDNLELKNTTGTIILKDETATLQNVSSSIFDGTIGLDGNVSTKNPTPTFQMDLNLNALNIAQSFNSMEMLQALAPIANALEGKLQTTLNLQGNLNNDLTPQLQSLAGTALAKILTAEVNPDNMPLLSRLDDQLNFLDLDDINLDNLKTNLTFNNGNVEISPFNFDVKGINVEVGGSHGFDMNMNYNVNLDVPARYLGSQVGGALGQLSGENIQNMMVALPVSLRGTFNNPQINLNMQQAVTNLTHKIAQQQKEKLQQKGLDAMNDILKGRRSTDNPTPQDTTTVDTTATPQQTQRSTEKKVEEAARNILGGILNNRTKKKDTTASE
ncbi:AsmA-like C-terminal region-containing protein [Salegentibacter sp. F188]|uniref:AsmA-like C-terminal region-containing protein n=1 Tax=Autumnicola patrickiae TaxID=3075591 RepID=A0ABU3E078_9FLAO|nr:AsmA-like C-terminal region-containing protein [Salegentibacter sp. F188]MDT0688692.1 AsmA-like C-terminal region-containing protein [Salegentibacter sp. F188]